MTDKKPLGQVLFYRVSAVLLGCVSLALAGLITMELESGSLTLAVFKWLWSVWVGVVAVQMWRKGSKWLPW